MSTALKRSGRCACRSCRRLTRRRLDRSPPQGALGISSATLLPRPVSHDPRGEVHPVSAFATAPDGHEARVARRPTAGTAVQGCARKFLPLQHRHEPRDFWSNSLPSAVGESRAALSRHAANWLGDGWQPSSVAILNGRPCWPWSRCRLRRRLGRPTVERDNDERWFCRNSARRRSSSFEIANIRAIVLRDRLRPDRDDELF